MLISKRAIRRAQYGSTFVLFAKPARQSFLSRHVVAMWGATCAYKQQRFKTRKPSVHVAPNSFYPLLARNKCLFTHYSPPSVVWCNILGHCLCLTLAPIFHAVFSLIFVLPVSSSLISYAPINPV